MTLPRPRRAAVTLLIALGLLASAACFGGGSSSPPTPGASPESVAERIIVIHQDEDWSALYDLYTTESQENCGRDDYIAGSQLLTVNARDLSPDIYGDYHQRLTRATPVLDAVSEEEFTISYVVDGAVEPLLGGLPNQLILEDGSWKPNDPSAVELACSAINPPA